MELSGTSFSAPIVSGVAALILGRHPDYTADQVKGALMLGTKPMPQAASISRWASARSTPSARSRYSNPPNANRALNAFIVTESGHRRASLRRGQLGGQGQGRRFVGGRLLGRRLLGRRLLVDRELGGRLLERCQLGLGLLGRHRHRGGFLGRSEPRAAPRGRTTPATRPRSSDGGAIDRLRARGHPRRHAGSLSHMQPTRGHPFGGIDRGFPERGMPLRQAVLRSAVGYSTAAHRSKRGEGETRDEGPHEGMSATPTDISLVAEPGPGRDEGAAAERADLLHRGRDHGCGSHAAVHRETADDATSGRPSSSSPRRPRPRACSSSARRPTRRTTPTSSS